MPDVDLDFLLTTVRQAGEIALRYHGKSPKNWSKPDGTHVTEADIAVDTFLKETITKASPEDGWLSEETPDNTQRLSRRRFWIVDPIDGTRLFLAGEHGWGIGVAWVEENAPLMSAVYCPSQNVMYHAVAGQGAFRNNAPMTLDAATQNQVIAPKSATADLAEHGLEWRSGSGLPLLLRFCAIAEGSLGGAITLGEKNDWDIAAGHLILQEAGGITTNATGGKIIYNQSKPWQPGVVSGPKQHHPALLNCVRQ